MVPFRWKNCFADVQTSKHDLTIQSYFDDVILPAVTTLEARIEALGRSDNPSDAFAQSDMEDVLQESKFAFALAIQSIWERQLREYLQGCARDLRPDENLAGRIAKADWNELSHLFGRLRGIPLTTFPSFADLHLLHELGNACRHGDGKSATRLYALAPDLWPFVPPLPDGFREQAAGPRPVAEMNISVDRLQGFVAAIAAFWVDTTYIYNESIARKPESLERRLVQARLTRTWLQQAAPEDAP